MLKRTITLLCLTLFFIFTTCSKDSTPFKRNNPLDPGGTNWHPPTVLAMADTAVFVGDSFFISAEGRDSAGSALEFLWALDGINFKDTTVKGAIKTAFKSPGMKIVLVKARDSIGVESAADTVQVAVTGNAPINLSPASGASLQTARPALRWAPGRYNSRFSMLLGTTNPPVDSVAGAITDTSFVPAKDLSGGKTYFWRVTGFDALSQAAPGEIWQFNTPAGAGLKPITAAGDSFSMGQTGVMGPIHTVVLKSDFYMDSTEITQAEFVRVTGSNPSFFKGDSNLPVEKVSWFDAVRYCIRRTTLEGLQQCYDTLRPSLWQTFGSPFTGPTLNLDSNGYRLPTEAEWEYACRAGSTTQYWWGNDTNGLGARAWFYNTGEYMTHPVAAKLPNRWGLYDMSGNVREWCTDWYSGYSSATQADPTGAPSGSTRVTRGGAYDDASFLAFSPAARSSYSPVSQNSGTGFRTVRRVAGTLPVIRTNPQSQSAAIGGSVTFSAWADGAPPPSYQWRKNNVNISGATLANYTILSVQTSDSGRYSVVVSNSRGKDTSSAATLTVIYLPITITAQPQNQSVTEGQVALFSITVTGSNPRYQWQRNGTTLIGATVSSYTTPAVTTADNNAIFRCVVSNNAGSVNSSWATLTVKALLRDSMVAIPSGVFQMGSAVTPSEQPVHMATITAFYMSNTEVTQGRYLRLMGVNPSSFTGDTNFPVENLTWFDAVLYCNRRSFMEGLDSVYTYSGIIGIPGNGCTGLSGFAYNLGMPGYRLPTEAEWEYACRAGTLSDYYWGPDYPPLASKDTANLDSNAWWTNNSGVRTHSVAQKTENPFGLYDMIGNVSEWCNDWYGLYSSGTQIDPVGPVSGPYRVARGGSWADDGIDLRVSSRIILTPARINLRGFRVVRR